jgi:NADH pyrophosphatase NudC (nudix superfamily)
MDDYEEWLRAGNGARKDESLFDAVARTVSHMYGDIAVCPGCGKLTNTFKGSSGKCYCQHCDYTWYD